MTPLIIIAGGLFVMGLVGFLVFMSVRGQTRPAPVPFGDMLAAETEAAHPTRTLLAVDGSPSSVAAVNEVAHCRLSNASAVRVVTVVHSNVPMVPDPSFSSVAAHVDDVHRQEMAAPDILEAVVSRLRRHRPSLDVTTAILEGEPAAVIVAEARAWHADRVVIGSHGYGRLGRALLGSTATAVAAQAPCSVEIARVAPEVAEPA